MGGHTTQQPVQVSNIATLSTGPLLRFLPPIAYSMFGRGASKRKNGPMCWLYNIAGKAGRLDHRSSPAGSLPRLSWRISKQIAEHASSSTHLPHLPVCWATAIAPNAHRAHFTIGNSNNKLHR